MKFKLGVIAINTLLGSLFISGLNVSAVPSTDLRISLIDVGTGGAIPIQDEIGFYVPLMHVIP